VDSEVEVETEVSKGDGVETAKTTVETVDEVVTVQGVLLRFIFTLRVTYHLRVHTSGTAGVAEMEVTVTMFLHLAQEVTVAMVVMFTCFTKALLRLLVQSTTSVVQEGEGVNM
jgi:hypothetical protein